MKQEEKRGGDNPQEKKTMGNNSDSFMVRSIKEETEDMRLISLNSGHTWQFIPGQFALLSGEGVGESYFAIASAPEDRDGMEFLVRSGEGVSAFLFAANIGDTVSVKGPLGKGFPIDNYLGRDLFLSAVGSAIAPLRSVLRSVCRRRANFGKAVLVYGVRHAEEFPLLDEISEWRNNDIDVILTVNRPETGTRTGKTGHVQAHFGEVIKKLYHPAAVLKMHRGEKAFLSMGQKQGGDELAHKGRVFR